MKKTILMMTFGLLTTSVWAQTTVKGVLMDKTLKEGEPYATVRVMKQNSDEKHAPFCDQLSPAV